MIMSLRRLIARLRWMVPTFIGIIGIFTACATPVASAQTMKVTSATKDPHISTANSHNMRVDANVTGRITYCAQGWMISPLAGQVLEYYGSPGIPELDYVLYHGYDGEIIVSVDGLDAARSESATAVAVWLAIAEQRPDIFNYTDDYGVKHGNRQYMERWEGLTDQAVKDASWKLYQEGLAYKDRGGGGVEAGCATLWINKNLRLDSNPNSTWYQSLMTVRKQVDVTFAKTSANMGLTSGNGFYALKGARYDIFLAADDAKVASIEFDEHGSASCTLAPSTSYYAVETKAPPGYRLDSSRVPFTTGTASGSASFADEPGSVKLTVAKKDSATLGGPQRGATLKGARFKVSSLSTAGWEREGETDENGSLIIDGIPIGKIQVVETKAPEGYRLDTTPRLYTVEAGQLTEAGIVHLIPENDYREHPVAFDLEIEKMLGDERDEEDGVGKPGPGIEFQIFSNTSQTIVGTIRTDEKGYATTKGKWFGLGERNESIKGALPYDRRGYTVKENPETTPEGFATAGDWTISAEQMADGVTLHYDVHNASITSRLQIIKVNAETGSAVPIKGFTFQILDKDKKPVKPSDWYPKYEGKNEFTTDGSGTVTLPRPLRAGTYHVRETKAQAPYLLSKTDVKFTIGANGKKVEPITLVKLPNQTGTGEATIVKDCTDGHGKLKNAEFDVIAREDVVEPGGKRFATANQIVGHVKTGEEGSATIKGLSLGSGSARYAFVETAPPDGHVLDPTPIPFTLSYENQETSVVRATVKMSDEPNRIIVDKRILGSGEPLPGATFHFWNIDDSVEIVPDEGFGAVLVRLAENLDAKKVELELDDRMATVTATVPEGARLFASCEDAGRIEIMGEGALEAGRYSFTLVLDGEEVAIGGLSDIEIAPSTDYDLSISNGPLGLGSRIEGADREYARIELAYDEKRGGHGSGRIAHGAYRVLLDGEDSGEILVSQGSCACSVIANGKVKRVPTLLKNEKEPREVVSGNDGTVVIDHVAPGDYLLAEADAPDGYLADAERRPLTVTADGRIEGEDTHTVTIENDYTKIEITKRDITSEEELVGAELRVLDAKGSVVDAWTSTSEPHRIDALAPGDYVLEESMAPRTYDLATRVPFTVTETGEVQPVTMYDEPVKIEGEVDKRQEIAEPTASDTMADEGANRAPVSPSSDGSFDYSVDFRSTSSTWVDEFTVEDHIDAAEQGLAYLSGIRTPQVWQDFDGRFNVWYKTNQMTGSDPDESTPNATLNDGHENPWLNHDSVTNLIGADGRALDYQGWRLWQAGVNALESRDLAVSDLGLAENEHIVAIRLEYGRVERGFTSRADGWQRDDLKEPHDDLADVTMTHEGDNFDIGELEQGTHAPLVLHMKATGTYTEGSALVNDASVHLYRNGGGEDLEDHDDDHVVQSPITKTRPLDQTGIIPFSIGLLFAGAILAVAYALVRHPRHPMSPTAGRSGSQAR